MGRYLDLFVQNLEKLQDHRPVKWLAEKTGVPANTLKRYLSKEREPGLENLAKIAAGFEIPIGVLFSEGEATEALLKQVGDLTARLAAAERALSEQEESALEAEADELLGDAEDDKTALKGRGYSRQSSKKPAKT